ncbi:MAG: SH3 domain-containing protein, partial [Eubacteriales bacterium]|nr:SH3 domain-containing protein [Eubacteriales bacterium]
MKSNSKRATAFLISASMAFSWAGSPVLADEQGQEQTAAAEQEQIEAQQEDSLVGTLAFAQCDSYINIRSSADEESDVTGKIYNNCAATIVGKEGDWYQITSGNASGYVSAEYFATGDEASQIADQVSYNVATVHPEVLMVRTQPDESSEVLDMAQQSQQLEVVQWDGDWMKVALDQNTYGYVNAYYVDYNTYYPVAETLEEEQNRLAAEGAAKEAAYQEQLQREQAETKASQQQAATVQSAPETEAEYVETEA